VVVDGATDGVTSQTVDVARRRRCVNGSFGSAERCSAGHLACVAAAVSRGMTGGRVCYARVGTAGRPDGDVWVRS